MILFVFGMNLSLFEPLAELLSDYFISLVKVVRLSTPPVGLRLPVIVIDMYVELDLVSSISFSVCLNRSVMSL